jgi:hypothetical protein
MYNHNRNAAREIVKALNFEQRSLYNALKDKKKQLHQRPAPILDNPVKEFTANRGSDQFRIAHDKPFYDTFKGHSPSGMQSVKYDILNPAKTDKYASQYSDLLSGKIVLNKSNPVSGYVDKA